MFKNILRSSESLEIIGLIAVIAFTAVFVMIIIYTVKLNKKDVDAMSRIPLEDNKVIINKPKDEK